jgi:hypothetical protein
MQIIGEASSGKLFTAVGHIALGGYGNFTKFAAKQAYA